MNWRSANPLLSVKATIIWLARSRYPRSSTRPGRMAARPAARERLSRSVAHKETSRTVGVS